MRVKQAAFIGVTLVGVVLALPVFAKAAKKTAHVTSQGPSGFSLERLPKGKNVTMPRPATTYVPLTARVVLTGTDMPQTLRFMPVNLSQGMLRSLRLAIFDQNSERVQYVRVSPDTPFLYPIKDLEPITVIAEAIAGVTEGLQLQVESDKPLDVAH